MTEEQVRKEKGLSDGFSVFLETNGVETAKPSPKAMLRIEGLSVKIRVS